jgi:transcriptional repressor NrdR
VQVIKRNGSKQEYDVNKIKLTLEKVSDEVLKPLTASDIAALLRSIEQSIKACNKEEIQSSRILRIVVAELIDYGFYDIAKAYLQNRKMVV